MVAVVAVEEGVADRDKAVLSVERLAIGGVAAMVRRGVVRHRGGGVGRKWGFWGVSEGTGRRRRVYL